MASVTPTSPISTTTASRRVGLCAVVGLAVGVPVSFFTEASAATLLGWDAAAALLLGWVWFEVGRLGPEETERHARVEDSSRAITDLLVVSAGVALLVAVAFALLQAGQSRGGHKAYLLGVGLASVVLAWAVVHTVFALLYTRTYYDEPLGGVDFNEEERPTYLDFAYLAFTVGMTFQVSDTNLTKRAIRRVALRHALLSYLFGAVIIALAINVVAGLLH